jgi:hypothetical protein
MAVRLTVVISQVGQGSSKQQTLEAGLIAELIGRAGIDVSLIGPLSQVEQSATDRLVLEGISGDFAIVAWQTPERVMEQLAALQISGRRSVHRADPHAGAGPGRRIYCFDWSRFSTAEELIGITRATVGRAPRGDRLAGSPRIERSVHSASAA